MREPAPSCSVCRAALRPADILYLPTAEIACERCWRSAAEDTAHLSRAEIADVRARAPRTAKERRWLTIRATLVFGFVAMAAVQMRQVAVTRLRMTLPRVNIEWPAAGATVPYHVVVRGTVEDAAVSLPLWLVARRVHALDGCSIAASAALIMGPRSFATELDLPASPGVRYRLEVVSTDREANLAMATMVDAKVVGWRHPVLLKTLGVPVLPEGATRVAGVDVVTDGPAVEHGSPPGACLIRESVVHMCHHP